MGDPWKSISPEGVRAFTYGVLTALLVWLWTEDYLLMINNTLVMLGLSSLLATSIVISTVISLLIILILYGLHGKLPTTLMLQHMTWVKNPDRFLFFFYIWINFWFLQYNGTINIGNFKPIANKNFFYFN